MSGPRVCVLLFAVAPPDGPASVVDAYHQVSRELDGTPGLVRNALLELVDPPGSMVVLSEWASMAAFHAWEQGAAHRQITAPLRPYQDTRMSPPFGVYRVAASYG
ncbi:MULTISPECIES: antibiotic biosynthesis monooxygenase family protein [unclassified Solwaraspora]|uniref:antibiotic biosynthesis monooxygenase family protein n=1 Tax=unclassified Solwaraspora TaxID=2627926 RepID=UPI00259B5107|nr:antibiotic biosynthesis monooxygenase [Solwaraspora sp. WMMA2056]WJK38234.1 antibiotic biosynthesis monooxygenase [Solwaraspora sp. WMMA2056]